MGWVYGRNPLTGRMKLACDICGKIEGVRKHSCPFGYCQAYAMCGNCWAERKEGLKQKHLENGCKVAHEEFVKTQEEKQKLLDEGKYLRTAALSHGDKVKVIFRNISNDEQAFFMSHRTYDGIPLMTNATVQDYQQIGVVEPAQSMDIYENV